MKILVTGNAGSGKTTLALDLAAQYEVPYFGLDKVVWSPGWTRTPRTQKEEMIQSIINRPRWVVDGVSHRVFESTDMIVFLDLPLRKCLFNIVRRFLRNGFRTRSSLPENCPEWIGVWKAIKIAIYYQRVTRRQIEEKVLLSGEKQVVRLLRHEKARSVLEMIDQRKKAPSKVP